LADAGEIFFRADVDGVAHTVELLQMLALPKPRLKKAAPCSEAEDAMPIPSEAVCRTLPSPAQKGLLRCEMSAVQPASRRTAQP
ncbi:hypothetical protein P0996_23275, partial [Xanthomonas hortorum pv. gardneri]